MIKRKIYKLINNVFKIISRYIKSDTVEMLNENTLSNNLGNVYGITNSLTSNSKSIILSAKAGKTINDNFENLKNDLNDLRLRTNDIQFRKSNNEIYIDSMIRNVNNTNVNMRLMRNGKLKSFSKTFNVLSEQIFSNSEYSEFMINVPILEIEDEDISTLILNMHVIVTNAKKLSDFKLKFNFNDNCVFLGDGQIENCELENAYEYTYFDSEKFDNENLYHLEYTIKDATFIIPKNTHNKKINLVAYSYDTNTATNHTIYIFGDYVTNGRIFPASNSIQSIENFENTNVYTNGYIQPKLNVFV